MVSAYPSNNSTPGAYPATNSNAVGGVRGKVSQFSSYVQNNPKGVRIIGGIGGIGLSAVSIMSCFAIFNTFLSPITYILNVFYLFFGIVISVVTILSDSGLAERIYSQAHFMSTLGGKAVFFLYLGALLFGSGLSGATASWVYLLIGSWMLFSSAVFFFVRCRSGEEVSGSQSMA
jgi:hypothetical protein